ncbi:MAG: segregation/condensation protein A [Clostridia bacterium]|nr:segregation/condensation protein A [Clostridia bacterium]
MEDNKELDVQEEVVQDVNNEEVSDKLQFKLENFEGPLDLLLHLIKQSKMEIENVELSKITEQYLAIMDNIPELDLEKASEFIEVAATLIEIKSKALLPKLIDSEEIDEEDPEALLLQRLQEYKLFKETSEKLKLAENVNRFYKAPEEEASKFRIVLKDMSMDILLNAFTKLLTRANKIETENEPKQIAKEKFTVTQKIASIKDALIIKPRIMFSELFMQSISRDEIITTFMALLELLKLQEIKVFQTDSFEDIEICKHIKEETTDSNSNEEVVKNDEE